MKKTYVNAMLQIVSIKSNDIVTGSPALTGTYNGYGAIFAPGERGLDPDDSWANEGY